MPQITLDIPQSKYAFFMELLKSFSFIKKVKVNENAGNEGPDDFPPRTKEKLAADFKEALEDVKERLATGRKGKTLEEVLNEL